MPDYETYAGAVPASGSGRKLTNDQLSWFLMITHAVEHILSASLPPLFPMIKQSLGLTYTQVGLLTSVRSTTSGLVQAPAGALVDRLGARKPLAIGFVIVALSLLLSGLAPTFVMLLLVQVLSGIGSSAFHPATYSIVSRLAGGNRVGKRMGFHTFGGFTGTTISYVLVAFLGVRLGWRGALIALAIPGFFLSYLFWILFNLPAQDKPAVSEKKAEGSKKTPVSALLALIGVTTVHGMFSRGLSSFMPLYLAAVYKMSVQQAGLFSTIMTGTGCLGLLLGGVIADRFSKTGVIAFSSIGMAVTCVFLAGKPLAIPVLVGVLMLSGLMQYGSNPSQTSLVTTFGSAENQGSLFGITFASSFLGGSLITIVAGKIADLFGVQAIFYLLAVLATTRALMTLPLGKAAAQMRQQAQAAVD